jgi:ribonucleoside-diphosphate reductase alpha chain
MMRVVKRNGGQEDVSFDKVLNRLKLLSKDDIEVNVFEIAQKVCGRIYNGVKTTELDELAAHLCSSMVADHPDYGKLASRIIISNHHKNTSPSFSETIQMLYGNQDADGENFPLVSDELYQLTMSNKEKLNSYIDYSRDYTLDYFGYKTLERSYLMRVDGKVVERPQHMWMRVSLGIHGKDFKDALQTYDCMSQKFFTHATPTLFNSGTPRPQNSSCYLLSMNGDSISQIYESLQECAMISKYSGGIGIHMHDIRAKGSRIRGTNGTSDGIIPMLRVFNTTARYVNQCFTPDTLVYTMEGAKRMDEVTEDDNLVTHDGTFKKVFGISKQYVEKDILEIRTKFSFEKVKVTAEHEVMVIPNQRKTLNYSVIKNRLDKGIVSPQFVLAKDMSADDLVGYPIPSYEKDYDFDSDFCRFYGIMIGDGHITRKKDTEYLEYGVTLNNTSKVDTAKFVEDYLSRKGIHYWTAVGKDADTYAIRWTGDMNITMEDLYHNGDKHVHSKFLHLPEGKTLAFVHGLFETDGSQGKEIYFHSTSYQVATSLRYILLRVGILSSGHIKNEIGQGHYIVRKNGRRDYIETKKLCYVLRIPRDERFKSFYGEDYQSNTLTNYFTYNGMLWSRINTIKTVKYVGDVYDFNMTDNHNYTVASLGLVHNSGKRNGSIAVYLEPWHGDIESFIELRKNHGNEEERCRDLFLALWIPDLFMKRVKANAKWSLMCPDRCQGLSDLYGDAFEELYERYEREGKYIKQINAQDLWFRILEAQIETGVPYLLFKDAVNRKSNQKNIGTIKSSNLCVAGDTMILTSKGYYPIKDLQDQEVEVWNGKEWSKTTPRQTGENQQLVSVEFSNGLSIRCTPYHKFFVEANEAGDTHEEVRASDLKIGMRLIRAAFEVVPNAADSGDVAATATQAYRSGLLAVDVPINASLRTKLSWLEGFVDGFGRLIALDDTHAVVVAGRHPNLVKNVIFMLQTLGTDPGCSVDESGRVLSIGAEDLVHLRSMGFAPERQDISGVRTPERKLSRSVMVTVVRDDGERGDTFCFNEPKEHKGIFNGVLTGQCVEIMEYSSPDETAVCNLSSVCLPTYIKKDTVTGETLYDFDKLHEVTKIITKNLNKVIDRNFYPVEKARRSNFRHRPIGIGIQGLADTYVLMRMPFESERAKELNRNIFETIYHAALEASMEISKKRHELVMAARALGEDVLSTKYNDYLLVNEYETEFVRTSERPGAYTSFVGSPASEGLLQFDLWNAKPTDRYDWDALKEDIKAFGIRNSLLLAPMPTASTAQIMGFNESFEPFTSNIFKRNTLSGEFIIVNKYLIQDLMQRKLWSKEMKDQIIVNEGSVQNIASIPADIRELYKTVWEIKQKNLIDMSADRGIYICQSQSLNLFIEEPDYKKLTSMHFYSWQKQNKSCSYYLRSKPRAKTQQFTIDPNLLKSPSQKADGEEEACLSCGA